MSEAISAFDLHRMLIGDEPPLFLLEIAFRTVVIYAYTLVLIRWIGSRSIAQLSLVEFLLVIALGSAVGDAMFYPDVPLLHCLVVITIVVLLDKALSYIVARKPRLEDFIEGKSVEVVRQGIINCDALERQNLGHDELFEQLRLKEIEQLGQVRAAFLETNGLISVFKVDPPVESPGLQINPPWDVSEPASHKAGEKQSRKARFACRRCGWVAEIAKGGVLSACDNCRGIVFHECSAARQASSRA